MSHCLQGLKGSHALQHAAVISSSSSAQHSCMHRIGVAAYTAKRPMRCHVSVSLNDQEGDKASGPALSSINQLGLSNAVMLANLLRPQAQRPQAAETLVEGGSEAPNAPVKAEDFVHALECLVRSTNNTINPEQFAEVLVEIVEQNAVAAFTCQQLAVTLKNLSVLFAQIPDEFVVALTTQASSQMGLFDIAQLSNVNWALMRLMPVADQEQREQLGMTQEWLQQYHQACMQQLQQVVDQQQQPPTMQQLANLLLIPAAAQQPFDSQCRQLFEGAMLLSQRRICAMAVAQTFTCYVRLNWRPQQQLLDVLLQHLGEDLLLYDYDELTQVVTGVYALKLQLPNSLLADITDRAAMLEASGQAAASDVQLFKAIMDRLARAAVAAS
eukprot:GHRR01003798.1.p1 GENE.GHRR01003798.1~~GHRR01003798.1.p1  ORF type:complete len:384 (+),score=153.79 GHRR01003798.1:1361-2512(+)